MRLYFNNTLSLLISLLNLSLFRSLNFIYYYTVVCSFVRSFVRLIGSRFMKNVLVNARPKRRSGRGNETLKRLKLP
jgi:hypothetical protein